MNLFKNNKGFSDVITIVILTGFIGAIFITGVSIYQEIQTAKVENGLIKQLQLLLKQDSQSFNISEDKMAVRKDLIYLDYLGYGFYTDGEAIYGRELETEYLTGTNYAFNSVPFGDIYKIEGADAETFQSLGLIGGMGKASGVGKDKNNIYGGPENADVATFVSLGNAMFKDKNALYIYGYGWGTYDFVDVDTLEKLNYMYLKDKNHVYRYSDGFEILEGENPKTFIVPKN